MRVAPLGMADDGQAGSGVEQHVRRDRAGVRAFLRLVNILAADREARHRAGRALDQDRGHAQCDIDLRIRPRLTGDRSDLLEV
jgi:hypothetical protein